MKRPGLSTAVWVKDIFQFAHLVEVGAFESPDFQRAFPLGRRPGDCRVAAQLGAFRKNLVGRLDHAAAGFVAAVDGQQGEINDAQAARHGRPEQGVRFGGFRGASKKLLHARWEEAYFQDGGGGRRRERDRDEFAFADCDDGGIVGCQRVDFGAAAFLCQLAELAFAAVEDSFVARKFGRERPMLAPESKSATSASGTIFDAAALPSNAAARGLRISRAMGVSGERAMRWRSSSARSALSKWAAKLRVEMGTG